MKKIFIIPEINICEIGVRDAIMDSAIATQHGVLFSNLLNSNAENDYGMWKGKNNTTE